MKDFLGQDITIGDSIVYPNRQRSGMWMNLAVVTDVLADGSLRVRREKDGVVKPLTCLERVVVVTQQIES
jgi:hypothetical protein